MVDYARLPFVKVNVNNLVTDWWNVSPTGDYQVDCSTGRQHFVALYMQMQSNPTIYSSVMQAMVQRGQWTGIEIGFCQAAANEFTA